MINLDISKRANQLEISYSREWCNNQVENKFSYVGTLIIYELSR